MSVDTIVLRAPPNHRTPYVLCRTKLVPPARFNFFENAIMHQTFKTYPCSLLKQQIKNTNTQTIYQHKYNTSNTRGTRAFLDLSRSSSSYLPFQYCTFEIDSFIQNIEGVTSKKNHIVYNQQLITTTITRKL